MTLLNVFLLYVCPTIGCVLCTMMFAAPVADLRHALQNVSRNENDDNDNNDDNNNDNSPLDTVPFVFSAGNTLGWIIYGYFQQDPFLVAANLPGFIVSLWLNFGAAKLQYHGLIVAQRQKRRQGRQQQQQHQVEQWDASPVLSDEDDNQNNFDEPLAFSTTTSSNTPHFPDDDDNNDDDDQAVVFVPQERQFFRIMIAWAVLTTYASWFTGRSFACTMIGWAVNICLVFFYASPLHTIGTVLQTANAAAIHQPTLCMAVINTLFWLLYGLARHDVIIVAPNATGLILSLVQVGLILAFPAKQRQRPSTATTTVAMLSNHNHNNDAAVASIHAMTPQPLAQQDVDDFD